MGIKPPNKQKINIAISSRRKSSKGHHHAAAVTHDNQCRSENVSIHVPAPEANMFVVAIHAAGEYLFFWRTGRNIIAAVHGALVSPFTAMIAVEKESNVRQVKPKIKKGLACKVLVFFFQYQN
jgi:hypothetical protein